MGRCRESMTHRRRPCYLRAVHRPVLFSIVMLTFACGETTTDDDDGTARPADAGAVDAGEDRDAGVAPPRDAGPDPRDGGSAPRDAGPRDAGERDGGEVEPFEFFTPAWTDGDTVPEAYTCDAPGGFRHQNNPEIVWRNPPPGTAAFVMIFDDPDARGYGHWAFFTDDASVLGVPEGTSNTANLPAGVNELVSSAGRIGYVPNCPGGALHTYRWRMWAVDATFTVGSNPSFQALERAAVSAAIELIQFTGTSDAGGR